MICSTYGLVYWFTMLETMNYKCYIMGFKMTKKTKNKNEIEVIKPEVLSNEINRDEILSILSEAILTQSKKVKRNRIVDVKKEKLRIENFKALIYGCNYYNNIYKDKEIGKILESFEIIKNTALAKEPNNEQLKEDLEVVQDTLRELKGN